MQDLRCAQLTDILTDGYHAKARPAKHHDTVTGIQSMPDLSVNRGQHAEPTLPELRLSKTLPDLAV